MAMTVTELAEQVRDSNQRLAEAIKDLRKEMGELRQEVGGLRRDFMDFRVDVTAKLGVLNTNLENLRIRVENSLSIAKWAITVIIPIVIGAVIWSYTTHERLARLESSITTLRDVTQAHGKQIEAQGQQIEELARVVRATPPIDPSSIKELIEQGKRMRDDLRQIKDTVSKAGSPAQPR